MSKFINLNLDARAEASVDPTANISSAAAAGVAAADKAMLDKLQAQQHGTAQVTPELPTEQLGIKPDVDTFGSPEGIARVREGAAGEQAIQAELGETGFTPVNPDEAQALYQQQLQEEHRPRGVIQPEMGVISIPTADLDMMKDQDVATVNNLIKDVAIAENAMVGKKGAIAPGRSDDAGVALQPHFQALSQLGLAERGRNARGDLGQWELRKGAGGAMYLATLIAMHRLSGSTNYEAAQQAIERGDYARENLGVEPKDTKKTDAAKRSHFNQKDLMKRGSLTRLIGQELEQVMMPSGTVNESGEAQRAGYQSPVGLTGEQYAAIGNAALTAFEQGGFLQGQGSELGMTPYIIKREWSEGKSTQQGYELSAHGIQMMANMDPVLTQLAPDLKRPVSLTPQPRGHFVGERATGQKAVTQTPQPRVSRVSPVMQEAANVVGEMPNIVSDHKVNILDMMYKDLTSNPESPFNGLFNQGARSFDKLVKKSHDSSLGKRDAYWSESAGKWKGRTVDSVTNQEVEYEFDDFIQDQLNKRHPEKTDGMEVRETVITNKRQQDKKGHEEYAAKVQAAALDKLKTTLDQARGVQGKAFYYGSTFIGNSSRMMITQTDLNWQSNKLARFMVDNPRASEVIPGGKNQDSFDYVVARAIMDGADKLTKKELVRQYKDNMDSIGPIADLFYQAAQANDPAKMGAAIEAAKARKDIIADEWEPRGEWGFVIDGLHELGKFRAHTAGGNTSPFYTRVKAEVDGINNGSSIQGLQFGETMILERAGVLYDGDQKVLDQGNMRDYLYNQMGDLVKAGMNENLGDHTNLASLWKAIEADTNSKESRGLKKALVKIPLMTTIYGMPANAHTDHVANFVSENSEVLLGEDADIDTKLEATKLLSQLVEQGLRTSLTTPLLHQDIIKHTAGWLFNIANIIPEIEGPNGYVFQSGGTEFFQPGDDRARSEVSYKELDEAGQQTGVGKKSRLEEKVGMPTATAPKLGRKAEDAPRIGAVTRNQLAVSGTHNIDSTIAQETLIESRNQLGPAFWGQQVFDAFIGDVSSLETMIDIGNDKFLEVNRRYNMYKAEQQAYKNMKQKFADIVNEDKNAPLSVGPTGFYKGVYEFARQVANKRSRWGENYDKMKNYMQSLGFKYEKGSLKGWPETLKAHEVKAIFDMADNWLLTPLPTINVAKVDADGNPKTNKKGEPVFEKLGNPSSEAQGVPIGQAFSNAIRETEKARAEFEKRYAAQKGTARQYN